MKAVKSPAYNYIFDTQTGFFARWGQTKDDDPVMSPFGCEIADIEISTICHGVDNKVCEFCYKSNNPSGKNMSLKTFKQVFANFPDNLTQIAFGIGDIDGNPDMWDIFKHCKDDGIIPNVTINGDRMTDEDVVRLAKYCGAVAVSRYNPKDVCYDAVKRLTNAGMKQVNVHILLAKETYVDVIELIEDIQSDSRLENLNAVVFLSLKQRGRGKKMNRLDDNEFSEVIKVLENSSINYGFDSCTAGKFLAHTSQRELLEKFIEPCESGLFSIYINVDGHAFPCSFTEFGDGINVSAPNNFLDDIWFSHKFEDWRTKLLACNRNCPVYNI